MDMDKLGEISDKIIKTLDEIIKEQNEPEGKPKQ